MEEPKPPDHAVTVVIVTITVMVFVLDLVWLAHGSTSGGLRRVGANSSSRNIKKGVVFAPPCCEAYNHRRESL